MEWSALEGTPAVAKDGAGVLFVGREPRISGALEREEEMAGGSKGREKGGVGFGSSHVDLNFQCRFS